MPGATFRRPGERGWRIRIAELLVLGTVIGANNFSAALALGALGQARRRARILVVFGTFEFFVPLVGAAVGQAVALSLAGGGRWISSALLLTVGAMTVVAGIRGRDKDSRITRRVTSWRGLVILAAGLSADNLAIGFSLGLGQIEPLVLATTIAVFSTAFTWVGISLGDEMHRHWERRVEVAAGALLIGLGIATLASWP
jgi:putative Mn2+ efflux pump MntP